MKRIIFAMVGVLSLTMFTNVKPASAEPHVVIFREPNGCGGFDVHQLLTEEDGSILFDDVTYGTCAG